MTDKTTILDGELFEARKTIDLFIAALDKAHDRAVALKDQLNDIVKLNLEDSDEKENDT